MFAEKYEALREALDRATEEMCVYRTPEAAENYYRIRNEFYELCAQILDELLYKNPWTLNELD